MNGDHGIQIAKLEEWRVHIDRRLDDQDAKMCMRFDRLDRNLDKMTRDYLTFRSKLMGAAGIIGGLLGIVGGVVTRLIA